MPAGTGVCVVKTLLAATTSRASEKLAPWRCITCRMRSRAMNAACPSFM
jgi:hypothetical protein